jgi:hypothetical protein
MRKIINIVIHTDKQQQQQLQLQQGYPIFNGCIDNIIRDYGIKCQMAVGMSK